MTAEDKCAVSIFTIFCVQSKEGNQKDGFDYEIYAHSWQCCMTACTHFRAIEYLLVPDSLSLTKKLASLQRCSWASACCRLTLPWYQLGIEAMEEGDSGDQGAERNTTDQWHIALWHMELREMPSSWYHWKRKKETDWQEEKKLADNKLQSVQIRLTGMYCRRNESTKSKVNWRRQGK